MTKKRQWRRRVKGTPNQIGKAFPIDDESQNARKNRLPSLSGSGHPSYQRRKHGIPVEEDKKPNILKRTVKALTPKPKKKQEKKMFGQPVIFQSDNEPTEEEAFREEVKEDIKDLKDAGVVAVIEIKREFKPLSEILKESRITKYLQRKAEERKMKRESK